MTTSDEKTIEISKTKFLLLILVSCALVAIGLWIFSLDSITFRTSPYRSPLVISPLVTHAFAIVLVIIFGVMGAFCIKGILENKPGLVFSSVGIVGGSGSVGIVGGSAGLIPWGDIAGIGVHEISLGADKIYRQKILVVKLANPEKYIEVGGALERKLNRQNHTKFGSPIFFSSNGLKIGFSDLQRIADEYFLKYGKRA